MRDRFHESLLSLNQNLLVVGVVYWFHWRWFFLVYLIISLIGRFSFPWQKDNQIQIWNTIASFYGTVTTVLCKFHTARSAAAFSSFSRTAIFLNNTKQRKFLQWITKNCVCAYAYTSIRVCVYEYTHMRMRIYAYKLRMRWTLISERYCMIVWRPCFSSIIIIIIIIIYLPQKTRIVIYSLCRSRVKRPPGNPPWKVINIIFFIFELWVQ